jgi:hypothetical protein
MEAFWRWLMRANARGVFGCAMIALIVVGAWWGWREMAGLDKEFHTPTAGLDGKPPDYPQLLAFLSQHSPSDLADTVRNPFALSRRVRTKPRAPDAVPPIPEPEPEPEPPPKPPPTPPPPEPEPPPPPPPPTRDTVQLTYRGIFKRTDGKKVALIEDSKSKRRSFYRLGARVHGTRVAEINFDSVTLKLADKSTFRLGLGETETFFEGLRDE